MLVAPGSGEIKSFPASKQLPGEFTWHRSPRYPQHFLSSLSISESTKCLSKAWGQFAAELQVFICKYT